MKNKINQLKAFFIKNQLYIFLIFSLALFFYIGEFRGFFEDSIRGFNNGLNGRPASYKEKSEDHKIGHIFGFIIGFSLVIFFILSILWAWSELIYQFLFQKILREYSSLRIFLFVFWILILFLLIRRFFCWQLLDSNLLTKSLKEARNDILGLTSSAYSLILIILPIIYGIVRRIVAHNKAQTLLLTQKSEAEIQALKAQINPHFLFNTLNNLYGNAIVEDSPKTAEGIMQLSSIMRHAVECSKTNTIDIEKEISFLLDYIEIQQMRIPKRENIRIESSLNWDEIPAEITPLILLTFVENAFKFGISLNDPCFVDIKLNVENQQLSFICRNSIIPRIQLEPGTGTGVENTLKRLYLLYPNRHIIQINQTELVYEVSLTINLAKI